MLMYGGCSSRLKHIRTSFLSTYKFNPMSLRRSQYAYHISIFNLFYDQCLPKWSADLKSVIFLLCIFGDLYEEVKHVGPIDTVGNKFTCQTPIWSFPHVTFFFFYHLSILFSSFCLFFSLPYSLLSFISHYPLLQNYPFILDTRICSHAGLLVSQLFLRKFWLTL